MKNIYSKKSYLILLTIGYLLLFSAIYVSAPLTSESAEIKPSELIKLETRPGVTQRFILIKPENPVASVILFAGSRGRVGCKSGLFRPYLSGEAHINWLIRERKDFAKQNLMVAVIDSPSDRPKGMGAIWRMGEYHAEDINNVVSYLKNQAKAPVWLVGASMGTFSALNGVIRLKEAVDGLVLTSSVTLSRRKWKIYSTHPNAIINMDLNEVTVPVAIVSHKEDKCELTPPSNAPRLKAALVNSPKVEVMYFTGGKKPIQNPCRALCAHGFYGVEDEVVKAIADFIKANSN